MENFIVFKYNASYIMENNVDVRRTYMKLHKIWTNELSSLRNIINILLV